MRLTAALPLMLVLLSVAPTGAAAVCPAQSLIPDVRGDVTMLGGEPRDEAEARPADISSVRLLRDVDGVVLYLLLEAPPPEGGIPFRYEIALQASGYDPWMETSVTVDGTDDYRMATVHGPGDRFVVGVPTVWLAQHLQVRLPVGQYEDALGPDVGFRLLGAKAASREMTTGVQAIPAIYEDAVAVDGAPTDLLPCPPTAVPGRDVTDNGAPALGVPVLLATCLAGTVWLRRSRPL